MIWLSHLICLIIISQTVVGKGSQAIVVSSVSLSPKLVNLGQYDLSVFLRGNVKNTIKTAEIQMKVLDKTKRTLESKTVKFDNSSVINMGNFGKYFGISDWVESEDGKEIQLIGYINSTAMGKLLQIELKKTSNISQILFSRNLSLTTYEKIDFTLTSVDGRKGLVRVDSIGKLTCRVYSSDKGSKPTFTSRSKLLEQKETYNEKKNEIQVTFRAQTVDHLSRVWCSAYGVNKSITINVLHAPTGTIVSPKVYKTIAAGTKLNCFSKNGYPQPVVSWKLFSGPENASDYYELQNGKRVFLLKKMAPLDTRWQLKCESSNKYGQSNSIINFTVSFNYEALLQDYAAKMDEDRLLWQRALMENISARNDQIEKFMRNGLLIATENVTKETDERKAADQRILNEMQKIIRANEDMAKKMKENGDSLKKKLEEMEKKMVENTKSLTKKLMDEIANKIKSSQDEQTKNIRQIQADMKEENRRQAEAMEQKLTQAIKNVQDNVTNNEFFWLVDKMKDKKREAADGKNEEVFSEYFYSHRNGYRMRLKMNPNGYAENLGKYVSVFFRICKGPYDDVLYWPMKKKTRLALVNQKTGQDHIVHEYSYEKYSDKFAYVYQKPSKDDNVGLGESQFISWKDLPNNTDILKNDMLMFRFTISD